MAAASFVTPGAGGLPKVDLCAADGSFARIYLHGAHVVSWLPANGQERLFLSQAAEFGASSSIRGGIPVVFPQFSGFGTLPKHGFLRTTSWELIDVATTGSRSTARLRVTDSPASRALWPHAFSADLTVSMGGPTLSIQLTITNTSPTPFSFTAALHTYLRVEDVARTAVEGLAGLRYLDSAAGGVERMQAEPAIRFTGEVDRVYFDAPGAVRVIEPRRTTTVCAEGFPDVVVWNPGAAKGATLADMEPDGLHRMVCVEAVVLGRPVLLDPGQAWSGVQILTAA